jgi:hypothetical protein
VERYVGGGAGLAFGVQQLVREERVRNGTRMRRKITGKPTKGVIMG